MMLNKLIIDALTSCTEKAKKTNYASARFSYKDETYVVALTANSNEVSLWANNGIDSLESVYISWREEGFEFNDENVSDIVNIINEHCNGFIRCSDCGAIIRKQDVAGRYFAGLYCKKCWENKWKAIEAKETYD